MYALFGVSFNAVLQLVIVALIGCWLARKDILNANGRRCLSALILRVLLPAMLVSSLSKDANLDSVKQYIWIVISAGVIAAIGYVLGFILNIIFDTPWQLKRITAAASSLGNASYIPMPFLSVICVTAPLILNMPPESRNNYIMYVSLYLVCHSPTLWLFGFPYLSGKSWKELKFSQIISPPIIASATGLCIAFIPALRNLFYGDGALLSALSGAASLLGKGVFPCALLLLGSNLIGTREKATQDTTINIKIPLKVYLIPIIAKLCLLPIFGFAFTAMLWSHNLIPHDPLCALVIMIESAVPPANNLIIMSQAYGNNAVQMARILFVSYCACAVTMTLWTMLALRIVELWV